MQKILNSACFRNIMIAILTVMALLGVSGMCNINGSLNQFTNGFFGLAVIVLIPVLLHYYFTKCDKRKRIFASIGGLLFSFTYVNGAFLFYNNDIFNTALHSLTYLAYILCLSIIFTPITAILLSLTDRMSQKQSEDNRDFFKPVKAMPKIAFFLLS